jgi:hypothetical protein
MKSKILNFVLVLGVFSRYTFLHADPLGYCHQSLIDCRKSLNDLQATFELRMKQLELESEKSAPCFCALA